MFDLLAIVGVIGLGIGFLVLTGRFLERRAKKEGPLFTSPPTRGARIVSSLFFLLFSAVSIAEVILVGQIHYVFPLIALAALGYFLGAHRLLGEIQHQSDISKKPGK